MRNESRSKKTEEVRGNPTETFYSIIDVTGLQILHRKGLIGKRSGPSGIRKSGVYRPYRLRYHEQVLSAAPKTRHIPALWEDRVYQRKNKTPGALTRW